MYTAMKFGAESEQIALDFNVPDVYSIVARFRLAEFYKWTPAQIDELSIGDFDNALIYMNTRIKIENQQIEKAKKGRR
jgi:hypothetical protein